MYFFVIDLPEDGLQEPKHVGALSQNNKWLFIVRCAFCWIKYYVVVINVLEA